MALKCNSFGNVLISGSNDKTILLWDIRIEKPFSCIVAHGGDISSLDISPDSSLILSSSIDGYCRLWDMFSSQCLTTLMLSNSPSLSFCKFSDNGNYLMYSALNNIHALYNTNLQKK